MFRNRLESATQMQAVLTEDTKPNCLIIDEIDGAPTVSTSHIPCWEFSLLKYFSWAMHIHNKINFKMIVEDKDKDASGRTLSCMSSCIDKATRTNCEKMKWDHKFLSTSQVPPAEALAKSTYM